MRLLTPTTHPHPNPTQWTTRLLTPTPNPYHNPTPNQWTTRLLTVSSSKTAYTNILPITAFEASAKRARTTK